MADCTPGTAASYDNRLPAANHAAAVDAATSDITHMLQ